MKKVFSIIGLAAIGAAMVFSANIGLRSDVFLSDLALANVEALARTEIYGDQWCNTECYYPPGRCWRNTSFFGISCQRVGDPQYECYCGL